MMIRDDGGAAREPQTEELTADFVVAGGGLAGTCAAITAAREGLKVVLVQDRPVLGGNASSEVRLWTLGATSHMGNNNRYAREGGVVGEIMVENLFRNKEGNPLIFDTIVLEKALAEDNLRLLLNTIVYEVRKSGLDEIASLVAYNPQNATRYLLNAPLFCDASGDGVVGFQAGAAFRMGAESKEEFGEPFATDEAYGHLLGHSIYFYSKDVGYPVKYLPPSFALKDVPDKIPRYKQFKASSQGCQLWWIEYGGRLDTVHQTEEIKWELWRIVYGVWDYIKNSGKFPESDTLTLEWVGHIPGKRESRRFEGDYILKQRDVIEQIGHPDGVAFGGWSIDHHPADGVYSDLAGSRHGHSRGVYAIPYRCYFSRNISNLFLAGRIISVSHVAFGTTRVMATCATGGQAVGMAASLCQKYSCLPRTVTKPALINELQQKLLLAGNFIPKIALHPETNLARSAKLNASSEYEFAGLKADGPPRQLNSDWAQMVPVPAGILPQFSFRASISENTELSVRICRSAKPENFSPDICLHEQKSELSAGENSEIVINPGGAAMEDAGFIYICFEQNPAVTLHTTLNRVSATLSLEKRHTQNLEPETGVESFDFWLPQRRPLGHNFAFRCDPPLKPFSPENVTNGFTRPHQQANCWLAEDSDKDASLVLTWPESVEVRQVDLFFDADYDHPMESVLFGHPENVVPFTPKHFQLIDDEERVIFEDENNHEGWRKIVLDQSVVTARLKVRILSTHGGTPAGLFEVVISGE